MQRIGKIISLNHYQQAIKRKTQALIIIQKKHSTHL